MPNPVLDAILTEIGGARSVLDIGCGPGALARALGKRGIEVTGIDTQEDLVARARETAPEARFETGRAEALPFAGASFDAAVFLNSLHHIPGPAMDAALSEAARILRPGGRIVVVEPLAEGPLFEVLLPVDDETEVRAEAQAALARAPFPVVADRRFERITAYADMEAFIASLLAGDPDRADAIARERPALEDAVARHARRTEGGFTLSQPMHLMSFAPRP